MLLLNVEWVDLFNDSIIKYDLTVKIILLIIGSIGITVFLYAFGLILSFCSSFIIENINNPKKIGISITTYTSSEGENI